MSTRTTDRSAQKRRPPAWWLAAVAAVAVIGIVAAVALALQARPYISVLDPYIGEPGSTIKIIGRNFGSVQGESHVELAGIEPTASSYVSWSDTIIEVRLPYIVDSGLVYVATGRGRSNPKPYMNHERLPVAPSGTVAAKTGPVIDSLSVSAGRVGDAVTLNGLNFGANRDDSRVLFSWLAQSGFDPAQAQAGQGFVAVSDADLGYESWSDKEIRVRVPDGAVSGSVYVRTAKGSSNYQFFRVTDTPGTKSFKGKRTYTISYFATISNAKATVPNDLYLWVPRPAETSSQREIIAVGQSQQPIVPDYRGVSVYRVKDVPNGGGVTISRGFVVQVYEVDTTIASEKVRDAGDAKPSLYGAYTQADDRIPATDQAIIAYARKWAEREKNPHKVAKALYDGLLAWVVYAEDRVRATPLQALADKKADAYSLAMLYCALLRASGIPALPVSGYLIDEDRSAHRHYWVEFFLAGFGWVPVDPALGAGATIAGFSGAFDDRSRYFGNLDFRHLAFSRGSVALSAMTPDGKVATHDRHYSLQNIYEEAAGGLSGYTAFWSDIEVTGVY